MSETALPFYFFNVYFNSHTTPLLDILAQVFSRP